MCNFRLRDQPASCCSIVPTDSPHGFCAVHERIYQAMTEFGARRQREGYDKAVKWAKAQRFNPSDLRDMADTFDITCVRNLRRVG